MLPPARLKLYVMLVSVRAWCVCVCVVWSVCWVYVGCVCMCVCTRARVRERMFVSLYWRIVCVCRSLVRSEQKMNMPFFTRRAGRSQQVKHDFWMIGLSAGSAILHMLHMFNSEGTDGPWCMIRAPPDLTDSLRLTEHDAFGLVPTTKRNSADRICNKRHSGAREWRYSSKGVRLKSNQEDKSKAVWSLCLSFRGPSSLESRVGRGDDPNLNLQIFYQCIADGLLKIVRESFQISSFQWELVSVFLIVATNASPSTNPLQIYMEIPLSPSTDQTVLTSAEPRTHPDANTNAKISANTKYPNIPRLIALAPGRSDEDFSGHATRHASASTSAAVSGTSSTVPSQQASTHPSPRHHYHFNHTVSLETKNVYSAETGATVSSQKCVAGSAGQRAHLSLGSQNQISSRCDLIPASQYLEPSRVGHRAVRWNRSGS